jgi:hypothetical protein
VARARNSARTLSDSSGETSGSGANSSAGAVDSAGATIVPETVDENGILLVPAQVLDTSGSARQSSQGDNTFRASNWSTVTSEIEGEVDTEGESWTSGLSHARGWRRGSTTTTSESEGEAESTGGSRSVQVVPFMAHRIGERVSSRTFLSVEEQRWMWIARLARQPHRHFVLKVPDRPAAFFETPEVPRRFLSESRLAAARAVVFAQPWYTLRVVVVASETDPRTGLPSRVTFLMPPPKRKPPGSDDDESF